MDLEIHVLVRSPRPYPCSSSPASLDLVSAPCSSPRSRTRARVLVFLSPSSARAFQPSGFGLHPWVIVPGPRALFSAVGLCPPTSDLRPPASGLDLHLLSRSLVLVFPSLASCPRVLAFGPCSHPQFRPRVLVFAFVLAFLHPCSLTFNTVLTFPCLFRSGSRALVLDISSSAQDAELEPSRGGRYRQGYDSGVS